MKIAFLIPTLGAGGAERVVTLMANFWAEKGHSVVIFSMDDPANPPFFTLNTKVQYHPLNLLKEEENYIGKTWRTISQILSVRKQVKQYKPDVLIAHLSIAIFLAITSTLFLKQKVVIYEGTNPYLATTNKYLKNLNNFLYRFADRMVLQTHQIAKTFPSHLQQKISVIYNPITKPEVQLHSEDYPRNFSNKTIVSVGRLVLPKAQEVLIEAFHIFAKKKPEWSLLILGEGEERQKLETLCATLNITEKVALPGRVKNPLDLLKNCTIFVLSSRYEGLPNALCEAMSIGLPVVATRCKFGPEEIIQHRKNGLLVPVEDAQAISKSLEELANDINLCEQLGTNAKDIVNVCSIERVMSLWEGVIKSINPSVKDI